MKWYSCELEKHVAEMFKGFLKANGVKFESSQCYNLVMVSVFCSEEMLYKCNAFIETF